eukprot:jgi/Botrbrau1/14785/Bobra.105_1s0001.1
MFKHTSRSQHYILGIPKMQCCNNLLSTRDMLHYIYPKRIKTGWGNPWGGTPDGAHFILGFTRKADSQKLQRGKNAYQKLSNSCSLLVSTGAVSFRSLLPSRGLPGYGSPSC